MTSFTPGLAIVGGCLIGIATVFYLAFAGRYAGISGILRSAFFGDAERYMDILFVAGLAVGGFVWTVASGQATASRNSEAIFVASAIGGVLVGFGTALGGGCTSGHGVCGLGRLSSRSFVAVLTFLAAGVATVFFIRHVLRLAA